MHGERGQIRTLVAVQSRERRSEVRQRAAVAAQQFSAEPLELSDAWVFALPPPAIDAAQRALALAKRMYEDAPHGDVLFVVHVDAGGTALSPLLRELLQLDVRDVVIFTPAAARGLPPDERRQLGAFRAPDGQELFVWPPNEQVAGLERLSDWVPPTGRYVVERALDPRPGKQPDAGGGADPTPASWLKRGLLDLRIAQQHAPVRDAHELVRRSGVHLIVGPAWVGKSHVARTLADGWADSVNRFVTFTALGHEDVPEPVWWHAWKETSSRALWVLDGADESPRPERALGVALTLRKSLSPNQRERLSLIVLQRDDSSLAKTLQVLGDARHYTLLPMDERQARRALGLGLAESTASEALERALTRLEALDAIHLAANARVLREAAAIDGEASLPQLWDRVLVGLFDERSTDQAGHVRPAEMRDLAARLAATMLLSQNKEIAVPATDSPLSLRWDRVFAADSYSASKRLLRSAVLRLGPDGASFVEQNTQEVLAAWILATLADEPLRRLLTDAEGCLAPGLGETAFHVRALAPQRAALLDMVSRATRPPLPPGKAEEWLERALVLSSGSVPLMPGRALRRLAAIESSVAQRLRASELSEPEKQLLIHIAWSNRWRSCVEPALTIALHGISPSLRSLAADFVCDANVGTSEDVLRLLPLLEPGAHEDAIEARATLLSRLLDEKHPIPWILQRAQAPDRDWSDSRSYLLHRIAERLSLEDALFILRSLYEIAPVPAPAPVKAVVKELEEAAARLLFREWDPADEHHATLVVSVLRSIPGRARWEWSPDLDRTLAGSSMARQALYLPLLGEREHFRVGRQLQPEDLAWLLALAQSPEFPALVPRQQERVLQDVYRLAREAPTSLGAHANDWLQREQAAFLAAQREREERRRADDEESMRELAELERRTQAERDASAKERRSLSSFAAELLRGDLRERLQLDWFGEIVSQQHHVLDVEGRFSDLSAEQQEHVLRRIRELLPRQSPTRVPEGTEFEWRLWQEAQAFRAAVLWGDTTWLGPELIRLWLPGLLYFRFADTASVVRRCYSVDAAATREVALDALERDKRNQHVQTAHVLPDPMWDDPHLRRGIKRLILNSHHELARAALLRLLAAHLLDGSQQDKQDVIDFSQALAKNQPSAVALAATDVLIASAPRKGLEQLAARVQTTDQAREALHGMLGYQAQPNYSWRAWDHEAQLAFARVLCRLDLSWNAAPFRRVRFGSRDDLQELRDEVLAVLAECADVALDALEQLVPAEPPDLRARQRAWFERLRGRASLGQLLRELEPPRYQPPRVDDVLDALDRKPVFLLRSIEDVFAVVPQLLSTGDDSQYSELVLRVPKDPSSDDAVEVRHERALQAYVLLRLREGFRRTVPSQPGTTPVEVVREPLHKPGDRPDFVVCNFNDGHLPIEVKWAHAKDCKRALSQQLGERYLVENRLQYGIFVVGFEPMSDDEYDAKLKELTAARDQYLKTKADSIRIEIVPLRFGSTTRASRQRTRRTRL